MSIKTRSKNFSADEISTLVDLVQENKSKLFGSLSSSLTYEEKNNAWKQSASDTVQMHRDTDGWDIPCEEATTVWNEPVAKNINAAANWVVGRITLDWIADRRYSS